MIKKHKSQIVAQTFFTLGFWATLFFIVYFHQNREHGSDIYMFPNCLRPLTDRYILLMAVMIISAPPLKINGELQG